VGSLSAGIYEYWWVGFTHTTGIAEQASGQHALRLGRAGLGLLQYLYCSGTGHLKRNLLRWDSINHLLPYIKTITYSAHDNVSSVG
jgi:hypothetical protein